jgi:putative transcriptional regulator
MDLSLRRRRRGVASWLVRARAWRPGTPTERDRPLRKPDLWSQACRTYLADLQITVLITLYVKTKTSDLSHAEENELRAISAEIRRALALESLEPFSGAAMVAAAQDGLKALKDKKTLRTFRVEVPRPLESKQIADIRSSLNASQGVFASYLGVSKAAVVVWEYGTRRPSGTALKLLSIARKNPSVLISA